MSSEKEEDPLRLQEDEEFAVVDGNAGDEPVEDFACKYCDFHTTNLDDLDDHIVSHDEALIEDDFEEKSESFEVLDEDTLAKFKISPPPKANNNVTFSIEPTKPGSAKPKRRAKSELPAFFEESSQEKTVLVCPYCSYQSMKRADMNKHLLSHDSPVELPMYVCAECPYQTRRKCDMTKHLLTHCVDGDVQMFNCAYCPYTTKRKNDLPKHMLCHTKSDTVDLYSCHRCTYSTKRKGDLRKHVLAHENDMYHANGSNFNCTECGYSSRRLNDLHKHVVLHCDKDIKGILQCTKCNYATHMSNRFAKHVLSNCKVQELPVPIFPKDPETLEEYIVLEEDDLNFYQLGTDSAKGIEKINKNSNRGRRKRPAEDHVEHDKSEVLEEGASQKGKVLVLTGYDEASN